jgi:hypothetical protein
MKYFILLSLLFSNVAIAANSAFNFTGNLSFLTAQATDWKTDLTWTFTGLGTVGATNVEYRRIGDSMEVRGYTTFGTATAVAAKINLPSGYTIDSSKFSSATNSQKVGYSEQATGSNSSVFASNGYGPFPIFYDGSDTASLYIAQSTSSSQFAKTNGSSITGTSGALFPFYFTIPITGWSSNVVTNPANNVVVSNGSSQAVNWVRTSSNCTSSPCTITQSGSWVTSVTRTGTGSYVVNIASGTFSAAPSCTVIANQGCQYGNVPASTSTEFDFFVGTSNCTLADGAFNVICMGPK